MKSRSAYLILGAGVVLVAGWVGMLLWNAARPPSGIHSDAPGLNAHYVLSDTAGRPLTERSFPGRLRLVVVGFTSCPDVCPTTLAKFRPALAALGEDANRVQPLFISVDPDRDTPQQLARYVRAFDPRIIGATGSAQQLQAFLHGYGLYASVDSHADKDVAYSVTHSSAILVIAAGGALLDVIDNAVPPVDIAVRLRRQLQATSVSS